MAAEDYKTTIKIEADTQGAEQGVKREAAAFEGLSKSIDAIKNAAAAAWQSISKLFESIGGRLSSLVSQVKELHSSVSDNAVSKAANEAAAATENLTEKQKELNEAVAEQKPGEDLTAAANEAAAATENLTAKQNALNAAIAAQKPGAEIAKAAQAAKAATDAAAAAQARLNAALAAQKPVDEVAKAAQEAEKATSAAAAAQGQLNAAIAEQKPRADIAKAARDAEEAVKHLIARQRELNAELQKGMAANAQQLKSQYQDLSQVAKNINLEDGAKRGKGAWESLIKTLSSARSMVTSVMRAFGLFYLAFEGLKSIYENTRKLVELWKEYKTAVERAALASDISRATHETNRLAEAQKNLNDQLQKQLTIRQRTASLREMGQSGAKSFTDEQRNVTRAIELAGATDPRQRQALEDRYAREDEARKSAETRQGISDRIATLSAEANAYAASADKAKTVRAETTNQIDKELQIQSQQAALGASDEEKEATRKRIEALEETRRQALKEQKAFEEEAAYRNQQIKILEQQQKAFEQLGTSAAQVQEAAWAKIEAADAEASKKLSEKLAANEAADKWAREFEKASPSEKINMLQDRESSARNRLDTLQSSLDEEMGKSVKDRDQERMSELRSGIESAQNEMFAARRQREGIQEETAGARQSVSLGAGSRLNAMGLGAGSGVQRVQQEMANSLKDLVRLGRDQLAALKSIENEDGGATFQ